MTIESFFAGEELESLAKEVMAQPRAVIERMKKVLGTEEKKK